MALLTTYAVTIAGTPPTFAAAASGDTAQVGDRYFLVVKNGDGSSHTVTIATPGNLATGDAYPDKVYTVTAGAEAWVPLLALYADATDSLAHLTWSATTSMTRAVVRI